MEVGVCAVALHGDDLQSGGRGKARSAGGDGTRSWQGRGHKLAVAVGRAGPPAVMLEVWLVSSEARHSTAQRTCRSPPK